MLGGRAEQGVSMIMTQAEKDFFFLPFINGEIDHLSRPIALKEIEFVTK